MVGGQRIVSAGAGVHNRDRGMGFRIGVGVDDGWGQVDEAYQR